MQVTTQPFHAMPSTNSLLLFILRCVPHTLTDESHFHQRSHSLLPQDACRTSWQVICDRPNFNVSDKTKIIQTCGKPQTQSKSNCQCMHNSSQNCKTDHSGFRAYKTHRHVMQQKWKLMQSSWQLTENHSNWVPQVQVPSSPKSPKTLKFQDIPKLSFHSNLSLTAISPQLLHFSSQLSSASKPSTTTRPGTIAKTYTLGGNFLSTQTILWASAANLYNKLPFWSNSTAFIVPCQRYSLGLYFRRTPASAFWR